MEEKRVLVTLGGRIEGPRDDGKKSWRCKFDLTDPNVWIQLTLVLLVLGLGASTIVLATNQNSSPPPPPPPNTTLQATLQAHPLDGLGCDHWDSPILPGYSTINYKTDGDLIPINMCVFPISESTAQAVSAYLKFTNSKAFNVQFNNGQPPSPSVISNAGILYAQVLTALETDGMRVEAPPLTWQASANQLTDFFQATMGKQPTLYYNGKQLSRSEDQVFILSAVQSKYFMYVITVGQEPE